MGSRELRLSCAETDRVDWPLPGEGDSRPGAVAILVAATLSELRAHRKRFEAILDEEELERAARFRFEPDRERYILGHGMLREVLGRHVDADPAMLRFARGPYGKPIIQGSDVHFNFSDTKDAVLVGTSTVAELGVDLETMHRQVDHDAVADHYFTPKEIDALNRAAGSERKRRFLELWTRKEAVLKACGIGLMDDLKELSVLDGINALRITHPGFMHVAAPTYHLRTWRLSDSHLISLAAPRPMSASLERYSP